MLHLQIKPTVTKDYTVKSELGTESSQFQPFFYPLFIQHIGKKQNRTVTN